MFHVKQNALKQLQQLLVFHDYQTVTVKGAL